MGSTNGDRDQFALQVEELEDRVAPSRAGSLIGIGNNDEVLSDIGYALFF